MLADPESTHALSSEQLIALLDVAPSLPVPQRVALLEMLAPVAVEPAHAAAAFQRAVAGLPVDALEQAHPALKWPPYPGEVDGTWVWVTAVGSVSFADGFRDVIALDPDGWLRVEERDVAGARSLVAEYGGANEPIYGADGRIEGWRTFPPVRIDYSVDGVPAEWDDAARDWLERTLSLDPEWAERLHALEAVLPGSSGATLITGVDASTNIVRISPDMLEARGSSFLGYALEGLGVQNPDFPDRAPRRPFPNQEQAVWGALFGAYHLTAHGLIEPRELEEFLEAVDAQLKILEVAPSVE